jgi:hypothetical protein
VYGGPARAALRAAALAMFSPLGAFIAKRAGVLVPVVLGLAALLGVVIAARTLR